MKQLFLGLAVVALMSACGKKEATESPVTETPVVEEVAAVVEEPVQVEEPVTPAAPAAKKAEKAPAKATQPAAPAKKEVAPAPVKEAVDPCDQIVKEYEAFADTYVAAIKNKNNGPDAFKAANDAVKAKATWETKAQGCMEKSSHKERVQRAFLKIQAVR